MSYGSRFAALPVEGEDSDSGSSTEEMKLSRDYYPTQIQPLQSSSTISTGSGKIRSRPISSTPISQTESSDLEFTWGHYTRESGNYDDVSSPGDLFDRISDSSQGDVPKSIEEDLPILADIGFNIEYPDGRLGAGYYGVVYRGYYGTGAQSLAHSRFAVKVLDFGSKPDWETHEMREMIETEKFILTNACHRNVVSIRMIINMGGTKRFKFRNKPSVSFLSPQRIYIIMEFADVGELDHFLNANIDRMEPAIRVNLIRDLFAGMAYLHQQNIVHGDVHTGNVLLFTQGGELVAKWADFGLGVVGSDKQYRFRDTKMDLSEKITQDIYNMGTVFASIMSNRKLGRPETPEEKRVLNEISIMIKQLRKDKYTSLTQVHQKFRHLLEDEIILNLDEQYFQ